MTNWTSAVQVTTFISNAGQSSSNASAQVRATEFTTGTDTYTLSSVGIYHGLQSSVTPQVQIYSDASGEPGTVVATMSNPGTIALGVNIYPAPANTTLSASTTYWVVTSNSAATDGQGFRVNTTPTNNLDSGTAAGWNIGNARIQGPTSTPPPGVPSLVNASASRSGGQPARPPTPPPPALRPSPRPTCSECPQCWALT